MVPIDLADRLALSVLAPGLPDTLHVEGFDPGPAADNLVLRAVAAARRHAASTLGPSVALPPLAARLDKRIPIAAGLAGGSSDAAAAADAALEAWGVDADGATPPDRRRARLRRPVLPRRRAGARRGPGERVTPLGWLRDAPATGDRPGC
jgi:4-diphosphocytidyl-2-C-methyl-D-erythritol kinase